MGHKINIIIFIKIAEIIILTWISNFSNYVVKQYHIKNADNNNGIFDGKHFHFEKKWIKKINYDDFLDKKRRICNKLLKKIKFRSYGLAAFIFFLFMLIGTELPILCGLGYMKEKIEITFSSQNLRDTVKSIVDTLCPEKYSYLIMFSLIIFILSVTIIIALPKILRNNEKYNKIKLMRE
ncbi:fam-m protein [Plasmodium brasilianum]|uniref:uncharacterized protein n=1 Tax=Plasmodium brasilianum TaxID=5824 RepID=UPI00350E5A66|nr:hypothetical protein MKS88_000114 [Plasmodium brasilianum]KAI4833637.1 hypothetical protein MKS88_000115 [Plasmodium brasilianum]KAI4833826.1 fam-m protein [Plasmodium brasilianum]